MKSQNMNGTHSTSSARIALFHPCLIHGGIQRVFVDLALGFLERGLAVDIVQATSEGEFRDQVPVGARLVDLNASRALTSIIRLARYLRRERPDAVISGAIQTNLAAVLARAIARVPSRLVLTEHNIVSAIARDAPMLRTRVSPFFVRKLYPWADEIVTISEGSAEDLAVILGIPKNRIHVIYNPVIGDQLWKRAAEPLADDLFFADRRPVVLAVGRLHYHKDFSTLLRAFAEVRNKVNARLLFLGDGEERAALTSLANNLGIASDVSFKGNVSNPLPYMKHAAVLALSSTVESFGLVLVEALAMGLPIVATDCPTGPREILRGGAYGTLVPVGDSSAFAEALVHVLQLPRRPAVPDEAFERFQHDRAVESYLALLGIPTETGER